MTLAASPLLSFVLVAFLAAPALGKPSANVKTSVNRLETSEGLGEYLILPFAFNAESTGPVLGIGGMRKGFYQEQMLIGGAAYAGEESYGAVAGVWDYRFPKSERTFISAVGMLGYFPRHRAYATPRELFIPPDVIRPGSNGSDPDVFIASRGDSNWWEIKLEYVLPIGAGSKRGMQRYDLERGLLVSEGSGGEHWNPLEAGVTVAVVRQYNRYQSYYQGGEAYDGKVHPFEFGLLHNNTDFPINPSRGSSQYVALHYDGSWLDSNEEWTFLEAEASKYFSLGESLWASQRVVALNAWTAYSPSWDLEYDADGGRRVVTGPPFMEGATLGGLNRMRGFRDSRFHDKASIYATAEYRYTLRANPLRSVEALRFLNLDWFQLVAFVEGGRVAPEYQFDELFDDWKSDVGVGLRAMMAGTVIRFDAAHSEEGTNIWLMFGHPF